MENYVANVIPHLQQWWPVLVRLSYLAGVVFAIVSLTQAVSQKQRFNRSLAAWTFFCAVLLLNLPTLMDSLSMTVFNQTSEQSLSYSPPSSPGSVYIQFAVYAIATVGVVGIARGVCLMRDTPNQAMQFSRGIVHLFGGIIAVNLVTFLRGIGATILLTSVSPARWAAFCMGAAAVWLFSPEIAHAAVAFGEMGQNVAENAKGVAKGITMGGYAAGAGMGVWGCVEMYDA